MGAMQEIRKLLARASDRAGGAIPQLTRREWRELQRLAEVPEPAQCTDCWELLPRYTRTGKPSKRTVCATCATRRRRAAMTPEQRRREAREQQRAYRARQRGHDPDQMT